DTTNFLICKNRCMRLTFEEALEYQFKCHQCGNLLQEETKKNMSLVKKELLTIEKELAKVKA
ncbi:hypothetical protein HYT51_02610, partial [Candidatus Woesearchaeota archaeon]|nr:hypothetical protein [Candidatus Woesearchaeota archaeon]